MYKRIIIVSLWLAIPLHADDATSVRRRTSTSRTISQRIKNLKFYDWLAITAGSTFILGAFVQAVHGSYMKFFSKPIDSLRGTYKSLNLKIKNSKYGKANKAMIENAINNQIQNIRNYDLAWNIDQWQQASVTEKRKEDYIRLKLPDIQIRYYIMLIDVLLSIVDQSNNAQLQHDAQRERDDFTNIKEIPEIQKVLNPGLHIPQEQLPAEPSGTQSEPGKNHAT